MSIQALRAIVPPPSHPVAAGRHDLWHDVESQLRTPLPPDYKDFITLYGAGDFYRFLGILSPFSKRDSLITNNKRYLPVFKNLSGIARDVVLTFPDPGGLLICGGDENGNTLFWQTGGEPSAWPIVYASEELLDYEVFETDLTGFLAGWMSGAVQPHLIDHPIEGVRVLERKVPVFEPNRFE
jgi:hypothetical protein